MSVALPVGGGGEHNVRIVAQNAQQPLEVNIVVEFDQIRRDEDILRADVRQSVRPHSAEFGRAVDPHQLHFGLHLVYNFRRQLLVCYVNNVYVRVILRQTFEDASVGRRLHRGSAEIVEDDRDQILDRNKLRALDGPEALAEERVTVVEVLAEELLRANLLDLGARNFHRCALAVRFARGGGLLAQLPRGFHFETGIFYAGQHRVELLEARAELRFLLAVHFAEDVQQSFDVAVEGARRVRGDVQFRRRCTRLPPAVRRVAAVAVAHALRLLEHHEVVGQLQADDHAHHQGDAEQRQASSLHDKSKHPGIY